MITPYRLINASELEVIQTRFAQSLEQWNQQYSLYPIQMLIQIAPSLWQPSQAYLIEDSEQSFALVDAPYQPLLDLSLFGMSHPCFKAASDALFLELLCSWMQVDVLTVNPADATLPRWTYPGSTALSLTLSCLDQQFRILLNPQWVYSLLPNIKKSPARLYSLTEASAKQDILLEVQLQTSTLSLGQLMHLKVGDVFLTDHPVNSPLNLIQKNQHIGRVILGHSNHYKSIIMEEKQ